MFKAIQGYTVSSGPTWAAWQDLGIKHWDSQHCLPVQHLVIYRNGEKSTPASVLQGRECPLVGAVARLSALRGRGM